ncbi:hypothetical protein BDM02DRAFT_3192786, partial [Thelephora ganbajun]
LAAHLRKCKKAAIGLALIAEDVRQYEIDCRQAKRCKISSAEHLEVVPEVEELMDVDPEPMAPTTPIDTPSPSTDAPGPSTSRYGRVRRLPSKYQDMEINSREIGQSLSHMPSFRTQKQQREEAEIAEAERRRGIPSPTPPSSPTPPIELERFRTKEDEFGRFRIYRKRPISELSNTPLLDHNDFSESGEIPQGHPENIASGLRMPVAFVAGLSSLIDLFVNTTIALLIQWFCSGTGQKSTADVQRLIDDVILHEDFKAEDLQGVNLVGELKKLDTFESSLEDQGWKKGNVKISVPCPKNKVAESKAVEFEIEGLLYRDLTTVIKNACQDETTIDSFHTTPFKEMWKPLDNASPIRLYGEAYTSDEMISAYEEVQNIPPHPDHPDAENVVVELAPYSDATLLAQFGTVFLWLVYIYFVNLPPMRHIIRPTSLRYVFFI